MTVHQYWVLSLQLGLHVRFWLYGHVGKRMNLTSELYTMEPPDPMNSHIRQQIIMVIWKMRKEQAQGGNYGNRTF
jgi:hypothetical protein